MDEQQQQQLQQAQRIIGQLYQQLLEVSSQAQIFKNQLIQIQQSQQVPQVAEEIVVEEGSNNPALVNEPA